MDKNRLRLSLIGRAAVLALAAGLSACGGGGGGGGGNPAPTSIALTPDNRDTVAHASAAGAMALASGSAIPVPLAYASTTPQALGARVPGRAGSWLGGRVLDTLLQLVQRPSVVAASGLQRPLTKYPVDPIPCNVSGSITITLDDRNENQQADPGDGLSMVFSACKDLESETIDGSIDATLRQIGTGPLVSMNAAMTMTQLVDDQVDHRMTLNGAIVFDYSEQSATLDTLKMTVDGLLTATVHTHLFDDTVTLQSGYTETSVTDMSTVPPGGSLATGSTTTTLSGQLESTAAGGLVSVSTGSTPMVSYGSDAYPSSGKVRVTGSTGTIDITALSATSVRVDLDADDNGIFESTTTQTWDWLL